MAKRKGVPFPQMDKIERACAANPHGFSVAFKRKTWAKAHVFKTMDKEEFLAFVRKMAFQPSDTVLIHARIATHGSRCVENCHGWRGKGLIFMHNGVLQLEARDGKTDSETFFRDMFCPAFAFARWRTAERVVNAIIGSSKFAFLHELSGKIRLFGKWKNDNGVLWSNDSYLPSAFDGKWTTPSGISVRGGNSKKCSPYFPIDFDV